jgi:hypothetical protein
MASAKEVVPVDPATQVDPKWAQQFAAKVAEGIGQALAENLRPGRVIEKAMDNREPLTTPEEAKIYDEMLQRDYMKIDPKKNKVTDRRTLYKPIHIFPQYQSANPAEFIAILVIEVYRWEKNPDDSKRRQILDSFNIKAKDFRAQYKPTVIDAIPELEGEES